MGQTPQFSLGSHHWEEDMESVLADLEGHISLGKYVPDLDLTLEGWEGKKEPFLTTEVEALIQRLAPLFSGAEDYSYPL